MTGAARFGGLWTDGLDGGRLGSWPRRWTHLLLFLFTLEMLSASGAYYGSRVVPTALLCGLLGVGTAGVVRLPGRRAAVLVALLTWSAASLLWSIDLTASSNALARMLLASALAATLWGQGEPEALRKTVGLAALLALALTAAAFATTLWDYEGLRVLGYVLPAGRNGLALGIVASSILAARHLLRWGGGLLVFVPAGLLGLTTSRIGIVCAAVGALVWLWTRPGRRLDWRVGLALVAAVGGFAAGFAHVSQARDVKYRVNLHQARSPVAALNGREVVWLYAAEMVQQRPLAGCGLGCFEEEYARRRPAAVQAGRRPLRPRMGAHSLAADLLAGVGVVGTLLALFALLSFVPRLRGSSPESKALLAVVLAYALTETWLASFSSLLPLSLALGLSGPPARSGGDA